MSHLIFNKISIKGYRGSDIEGEPCVLLTIENFISDEEVASLLEEIRAPFYSMSEALSFVIEAHSLDI